MNHYEIGYDEGYYVGRNQAKTDRAMEKAAGNIASASGSLLGLLFSLLLRITSWIILYSGPLVAGYWVLHTFNIAADASTSQQMLVVAVIAFGTTALVFILKAILVSFKEKGNMLWIIMWLFCFGLTTLLPFFAIERIAAGLLHMHSGSFITWALAAILCSYIYFKYELTREGAPAIFRWVYAIGKVFA